MIQSPSVNAADEAIAGTGKRGALRDKTRINGKKPFYRYLCRLTFKSPPNCLSQNQRGKHGSDERIAVVHHQLLDHVIETKLCPDLPVSYQSTARWTTLRLFTGIFFTR